MKILLLKEHVTQHYNLDALPDIKKEMILKILNSFDLALETIRTIKENDIIKFDVDELQYIKKEIIFQMIVCFNSTLEDDIIKFRADELQKQNLIQRLAHSKLALIEGIINFSDIEFLEYINGFLHPDIASIQLTSCLRLYTNLQHFSDSGIDEKHYYDEVNSLTKKADFIQKFSHEKINLDNTPKHPTDIIRDFFTHVLFDGCELEIVQKVIKNTKAVFKETYKKKPSATKSEKEIISKYGSLRNYKIEKIIKEIDLRSK